MGSEVPNLSGKDQNGETIQLRQMSEGGLVVYFYPKDATPGCTKEACAFRDAWGRFEKAGVEVLGVSSDNVESHQKFAEEQRLPFRLIADADGKWGKGFGVGGAAGFYSRVSFLIGKSGRVEKVYEDVDPAVHADEVLKDAAALQGP